MTRIVIVGPGALGSLLAARIFLYRQTVGDAVDFSLWLLDHRADRAGRLTERGIVLKDVRGRRTCRVRATADCSQIDGCDVLMLTVKATAVTAALRHVAPLIAADTLLVFMQNGIGHLDAARRAGGVPVAAVTSEGANLVEPGHVVHGGAGMTRLGFLESAPESAPDAARGRLAQVTELLSAAGIRAEQTDTPQQYLWAKLFVNVGINALTAIYNVPNGKLLDSPDTRKRMECAVREAEAVARALGIPMTGDPLVTTHEVCRTTAQNISSMLQDVRNKRRTEIDAINGAIVAEGRRLAVPTPMNEELVAEIKKLEAGYLVNRS